VADLRCHHHPDRDPTGRCDRCGNYLCEQCLEEVDGLLLCKACRDVPACRYGHVEEPRLDCCLCGTALCEQCAIEADGLFYCKRCSTETPETAEAGAERVKVGRVWLGALIIGLVAVTAIGTLVLLVGSKP